MYHRKGVKTMPYETPDTIGSGEWCRRIILPDDDYLITIMLEALTSLGRDNNWVQVGAVSVNQVADIFKKAVGDMTVQECETMEYPRSAFIPGSLAHKTAGAGTMTTEQSSAYLMAQRTYLSSPAVGNKWEYSFLLAQGNYEMRTVIQRVNSVNGFQMDWRLNGVTVIDNMSFLGGAANVQINTPISILNAGAQILECELVVQTGSATIAPIHYIQFVDSMIALP